MYKFLNLSILSHIYELIAISYSAQYECTVDQELVDAAAQVLADASYLLTRWQHFSACLSIYAYLLVEQSC